MCVQMTSLASFSQRGARLQGGEHHEAACEALGGGGIRAGAGAQSEKRDGYETSYLGVARHRDKLSHCISSDER